MKLIHVQKFRPFEQNEKLAFFLIFDVSTSVGCNDLSPSNINSYQVFGTMKIKSSKLKQLEINSLISIPKNFVTKNNVVEQMHGRFFTNTRWAIIVHPHTHDQTDNHKLQNFSRAWCMSTSFFEIFYLN